jgi:hypothetical protein
MILKNHHKRAARYFLVGLSPSQIAKRLPGFSITSIRQWQYDLEFKKYLLRLEKKYIDLLDNDIRRLQRSATVRLQEILDTPYTSRKFELTHFEWAVNKVFQITLLKEKTLNLNQVLEQREGKAAETHEQKEALKNLVKAMGDPQRYGQQAKMGEA